MNDNDKVATDIQKGLPPEPSLLPDKIEYMNIPLWEAKYKFYKMVNNVLLPNRELGLDYLNSKILNIPVKYIGLGLIALKLMMRKK